MKVRTQDFLKHISLMNVVAKKHATLPIIDNTFFLKVSEDSYKMTATDLENTLSVKGTCVNGEDTEVVMTITEIKDILSKIPDIEVDIEFKEGLFIVNSFVGSFSIPTMEAQDYPEVPMPEGENNAITMPMNDFMGCVEKCLSFVAADELRPVMNGINVKSENGKVKFCGTDAHKLSVAVMDADLSKFNFILQGKCATLLTKLNKDQEVTITIDDRNAFFALENVRICSRLIEGRYPAYESVIPKDNNVIFKVNKSQLMNLLSLASITVNKSTNIIVLSFDTKTSKLNISSQDIDFNKSSNLSMECETIACGEDTFQIGFKGTFLSQCINDINDEFVTFYMSEPNRAALVSNTDSLVRLIMPMMIG